MLSHMCMAPYSPYELGIPVHIWDRKNAHMRMGHLTSHVIFFGDSTAEKRCRELGSPVPYVYCL